MDFPALGAPTSATDAHRCDVLSGIEGTEKSMYLLAGRPLNNRTFLQAARGRRATEHASRNMEGMVVSSGAEELNVTMQNCSEQGHTTAHGRRPLVLSLHSELNKVAKKLEKLL